MSSLASGSADRAGRSRRHCSGLAARRWRGLPRPDLRRGLIGLAAALGMILAGNFALTGTVFISKSGSVFVFARLMQDGIVQRLLKDTCPPAGNEQWQLCPYKNRLPQQCQCLVVGRGQPVPCPGRLCRQGAAGRRQPHHRGKREALSADEPEGGGVRLRCCNFWSSRPATASSRSSPSWRPVSSI